MFRPVGIALLVVLVLGLVLTAAVSADADTPSGATAADAVWVSCGNPISGQLAAGARTWAKFQPFAFGRDVGVIINFTPVTDSNPKNTADFNVWYKVKRPWGLSFEQIGQGTWFGPSFGQKTWRGSSNLLNTHFIEIVADDAPMNYTLRMNCTWLNPKSAP